MAAERHINRAVEQGERAALVLVARVENLALGAQRIGYIHGPAGHRRAMVERQRKQPMTRTRGFLHGSVEENRSARFIHNRRAGDAKRIDVAAAKR